MNIWNILQIEPTADRKMIRQAYAARSRIVHPEEKPEEFRLLYEAYQEALEYAQSHDRSELLLEEAQRIESEELKEEKKETEKTELQKAAAEDVEQEILAAYFREHLQKQETYLEHFQSCWADFENSFRTVPVMERWKEYLRSEEFQEIKWHPFVRTSLAEAVNGDLKYEEEFLCILWDIYGFQNDGSAYGEDAKKLARFLRFKSDLTTDVEQEQQQTDTGHAVQEKTVVIIGIVVILFLAAAPFLIYHYLTADQRYVSRYMQETYPEEQFSSPERIHASSESERKYELYSEKYPELPITVEVSGYREYQKAEDNYGGMLLKYYAKQYGLSYGVQSDVLNGKTDTLYYPDYDHIDEFCSLVAEMFREQEDLRMLDEVGICMENMIYPNIMIKGGEIYSSLSEEQIYTVDELIDEMELSVNIRKSYVVYMFNYEAWNLTSQQYRKLGPVYEAMCEKWGDKEGEWYDLYDGDEKICRLFIAVYTTEEPDMVLSGYQTWSRVTWITTGNIWHLFRLYDADTAVLEDGSGFRVEYNGETMILGEGTKSSLRLRDMQEWY